MHVLPDVIINIITSFIAEPDDYFGLKSTCHHLHYLIPRTFIFQSPEHVSRVSKRLRSSRDLKFMNVVLKSSLTAAVLVDMVGTGIHGTLITTLLASMSLSEVDVLVTTYRRWLCFVLDHAARAGRLAFLFLIFRRAQISSISFHLCASVKRQIAQRVAELGSDADLTFLFHRLPGLFDRSLCGNLLIPAIRGGHHASVSLFRDMGTNFDISRGGVYPLHAAVESRDSLMVEFVLRTINRPSLRYRHGQVPPLHKACLSADVTLTRILIDGGVSTNERDFYGRSALQLVTSEIRRVMNYMKGVQSESHTLHKLKRIEGLLLLQSRRHA